GRRHRLLRKAVRPLPGRQQADQQRHPSARLGHLDPLPARICNKWVHWQDYGTGKKIPVVLMGDAAHTAHFSIGSGTKLALEDAISLAQHMNRESLEEALKDYEAARSVDVLRIQNAARNSTEWFENVARYANMKPEQFTYSMLTRSQRISHENLRLRDAAWIEQYERWLAAESGLKLAEGEKAPPPMFTPFKLRDMQLKNRIVLSP